MHHTSPYKTGTDKCWQGNTVHMVYYRECDISLPDQNPLPNVPLAGQRPDISPAKPTKPCYSPLVSPRRKILPSATYQSVSQTEEKQPCPVPSSAVTECRRSLLESLS